MWMTTIAVLAISAEAACIVYFRIRSDSFAKRAWRSALHKAVRYRRFVLMAAAVSILALKSSSVEASYSVSDASMLWAWTLHLTDVKSDSPGPEVIPVSHRWLIAHACAGRECKVFGWYPNTGGSRVYLDYRLDPSSSLLAASIVVHEMVHYLQHASGQVSPAAWTCETSIAREREAYAIQRRFLLAYGVYQPVGTTMARMECSVQ